MVKRRGQSSASLRCVNLVMTSQIYIQKLEIAFSKFEPNLRKKGGKVFLSTCRRKVLHCKKRVPF